MELPEFRRAVDLWLDEHAEELAPPYPGAGSLEERMAQIAKVRRMTYDAGWARYGWPELVGGRPGSSLLRAYMSEALTARDLVNPGLYSMPEVLAPSVITFGDPGVVAAVVPPLLRGDEVWCQGFSEPGTGSNLAGVSCRARRSSSGGWVVTGQKVWTSLAQFATRCVLLARSGPAESAHRGLTAFLVDMDAPGISVRPIETMDGETEFCEVFFDEVALPPERALGGEGSGWAFAMDLLPYERSTALWQRSTFLHHRLDRLVAGATLAPGADASVGQAIVRVAAFRARSRATQHRAGRGERLGPETSVDKILLAIAEQSLYDLAADEMPEALVSGAGPEAGRWRSEYLYSRAASIYGGTIEIQRNIVARRLLDLGDDH